MKFKQREIETYCSRHSAKESAILYQLERETHLKTLAPQMLSGHLQGRFLSMISHMVRPQFILEIGTFTGYSAICMAEGLLPGGKLHTIEIQKEYHSLAHKYFEMAGFADRIIQHSGDALEIIPGLTEIFDLIFLDASKLTYLPVLDQIKDKLRKGGILLADNMLWSGKVLTSANDADTVALRHFAFKIQEDPTWENVLLPVRDGLMICRKK